MEDSALLLKKEFDRNGYVGDSTVEKMLASSPLIKSLINNKELNVETFVGLRALEWRLLELSEIPYSYTLEKVSDWLNLFVNKTYLDVGFTLTGDSEGIFACHNALITKILLKMNYNDKKKIDSGIDWILKYQSLSRNETCSWKGKNLFTKWGGCMKSVPCYYGVIKSLNTLTEYKNKFGTSDEIEEKLSKGLEYVLKHNVYKRLSINKPIEPSIIKNFYPWTYKSNIIEILSLLRANNLLYDKRCKDAIDLLRNKQRKDGWWQSDISFMKSSWIDFDPLKKPGSWISYEINKIFENLN